MKIVRETRWVRVWRLGRRHYVDSKYRTGECDASSEEFLAKWHAAKARERRDLEVAFRFFPDERSGRRILKDIARADARLARRLESTWIVNKPLKPADLSFQQALAEWLIARRQADGYKRKMVLDTKWFCAYLDEGGIYIEPKGQMPGDVPAGQFWREHARLKNPRDRWCYELFWGFYHSGQTPA